MTDLDHRSSEPPAKRRSFKAMPWRWRLLLAGVGTIVLGVLMQVLGWPAEEADPDAANVMYNLGGFLLWLVGVPLFLASSLLFAVGRFIALLALIGLELFGGRGRSTAASGLGGMRSGQRFPMRLDRVLGDAGNATLYERPDGSRYVLDSSGRGGEVPYGTTVHGPARFDTRDRATGVWAGSSSSR